MGSAGGVVRGLFRGDRHRMEPPLCQPGEMGLGMAGQGLGWS